MALDGLVIRNIVHELNLLLIGGRIDKIYQTEKEDILLTIRNQGNSYKLLLTANSNYPRLHLSTLIKNNPSEPPMFCMLLRKHIGGGKIVSITQPDLERIVTLSIEATNELGDKETKNLIIEIMGRHSNIILTKQDDTIIDSIKHISFDKSSVREILPNKIYITPPSQNKASALHLTQTEFETLIKEKQLPLFKSLYMSFNGISPYFANAICHEANLPEETLPCTVENWDELYTHFTYYINRLLEGTFSPVLYFDEKHIPSDFYSFELSSYKDIEKQNYTSISELLEYFYFERSTHFNVSQKTGDIKKLVNTFLDRAVRKKHIQEKALEDAANKETYKIYGELLTVYSHSVPANTKSFKTLNYYNEPYEEITIPLKSNLSAIENAQAYYKLYNKAKRTELAAKEQLLAIEEDIKYLQSVLLSLDLLETKEDISELRQELVEMGYLKKKKEKRKLKPSKKDLPFLHFNSSKGHDIYVGKNNFQNDQLTMKFAKPNDLWLHIKDGPGSHVIVKSLDGMPIEDSVILEAATLAAYYSSGKMSSHVPIDYTYKRNVKKVPNAKPGMVIYVNFKTLFVTPTEAFVKQLLPK